MPGLALSGSYFSEKAKLRKNDLFNKRRVHTAALYFFTHRCMIIYRIFYNIAMPITAPFLVEVCQHMFEKPN